MRRFLFAFIALFSTLVLLGSAPATAKAKLNNADVSGPYSGTVSIEFGTHGCSFAYQRFAFTYEAQSGGTGTLDLQGCVDTAANDFRYSATFVLTTPSGATLSGTGTGPSIPFVVTLTISTSSLKKVSGTIQVQGNWDSGTLTGSLSKAKLAVS